MVEHNRNDPSDIARGLHASVGRNIFLMTDVTARQALVESANGAQVISSAKARTDVSLPVGLKYDRT